MNFYNNQTLVILSAERPEYSREQREYITLELIDQMYKLGYSVKRLFGVYRGASEHSITVLLPVPYNKALEEISEVAFDKYSQESILVLNPDRTGYLKYTDGSEENMEGRFTASSEKPNTNAYTYDPTTELYYVFDGGAK